MSYQPPQPPPPMSSPGQPGQSGHPAPGQPGHPAPGQPGQPGHPAPGQGPATTRRGNPLGVAALIVGIVAFVGAFIPVFNYLAVLLGLTGLVLGLIAWALAGRRKGAAIAGTIVSFLGLALATVLAVFYTIWFFGNIIDAVEDGTSGATTEIPLVYEVEGSGSDVDITYTAFDGDTQVTEQETGERLPFERSFDVGFGGADTYTSYTITAVNGGEGGSVTCRITLDDRVLVEDTASGDYATATCTASGTQLLEQ